jgi:hypothetical protein
MTQQEALVEAQRRWGIGSVVIARKFQGKVTGYEVLAPIGDGCFNCEGSGPTWEAAFADANRRETS